MKIVLLEDIKKIGKKGEIKEISDGYARNFLFPKKLAQPATEDAIKEALENKKEIERQQKSVLNNLRNIASQLKGKIFILKAKEKNGKLFGSVSAREINQAIKKSGIEIEEKSILLQEPLKKTGTYEVKIEFSQGIGTTIKIVIEKD